MIKAEHRWLLAIGVLVILGRSAVADSELRQPAPIGSVSMETVHNVQTEPVPTPAGIADQATVAGVGFLANAGGCPSCQRGRVSRCPNCCPTDKPWSLPQPCLAQCLGIKIGGWLQSGITFNAQHPDSGFNGPVATNDLDREYQMNQFWFYADRPVKRGEGLSIGGHFDIMYGTDWRFGINYGLEDKINGFDRQTYGIVMPQLYGEVAYGNLSVKLGHYGMPMDYETIPAPPNPFYSHSYSYGYTVPQLVTGMLADYMVTDQLSIQAGFHRGWFMWRDINSSLDVIGGFKWNSVDKRNGIAYLFSTGPQDPAGDHERFEHSLVLQHQITERLRCVLVQSLGYENDALRGGQDAEWYGLNKYFLYTINPCWAFNVRAEWLRDDDGARIAGPGNIPGVRAFDGRGFAGNFYEITLGLKGTPHPNVMIRPEIRWDWYDGLAGPTGLPFDGGTSDDQFLLATDVIFTY